MKNYNQTILKSRGFTLLELLVVMAITGMVMVTVISLYVITLSSKARMYKVSGEAYEYQVITDALHTHVYTKQTAPTETDIPYTVQDFHVNEYSDSFTQRYDISFIYASTSRNIFIEYSL